MPLGQGVISKAAFKVENTAWGTSTDCGAGNQIHFISESISHAVEQAQAVHNDGNVGAKTLYPIRKKYSGDLLVEAHYSGIEALIACAMGKSHQDYSPVSTSAAGEEHFFEISPDMSSRTFNGYEMTTPSGTVYRKGSLCMEKDVSVWELSSAMINAMNFEAGPERVTFSFTVAGRLISFDSATNPNSSSWTLPTNTEQITWDDLTVYIKARDEFTISSANDVFVINESGVGDIQLDIADGTYTGYELAQLIANKANADGTLVSTSYRMEYDEQRRRFKIWNDDTQTFYVGGAIVAMDMDRTTGFTKTNTVARFQESDFDAIPDAMAAFAAGDAIGISKVSLALENSLDIESQDSESALYILEPERNDTPRVTGTMEIPRYKNDTWLKSVSGATTYMIWLNFTGSTIDTVAYELNLYLPDVKFTNVDAPISGPELIKQTLAFEAEVPNFLDFVNFTFGAYKFNDTVAATGAIISFGAYTDGLYAGGSAGQIYRWDQTAWTLSTDIGANAVYAIRSFKNKLYAGAASGQIWEYDGTSWSLQTDVGSGIIEDFVEFNGGLYAVEGATGKVFKTTTPASDGWSVSTDTSATNADRLEVYNGYLYMIGTNGSTWTRVYRTATGAANAWSISTDIATSSAQMGLAVHRGRLYAAAATRLHEYDGVKWRNLGSMVSTAEIVSYAGNLLMLEAGSSGDLWYWDFSSSTDVNVYSSLNLTTASRLFVYANTLWIAHTDTQPKIFQAPKELTISIQNQNSTNPL